jgi:hypothetical protein
LIVFDVSAAALGRNFFKIAGKEVGESWFGGKERTFGHGRQPLLIMGLLHSYVNVIYVYLEPFAKLSMEAFAKLLVMMNFRIK